MLCLPLEVAVDPSGAGQKAARLATLVDLFPIPDAFVLVSENFFRHVSGLPISTVLNRLDIEDWNSVLEVSGSIKKLIVEKPMDAGFLSSLTLILMEKKRLVVRSSSVQEDLPNLSFAGIYDSFLDVAPARVDEFIKLVWSSVYNPRALSYRHYNKLPQDQVSMAVIVQEMVEGISGVMFTANPNTGARETLIEYHADGVVHGTTEPHRIIMASALGTREARDFPRNQQTMLYRYGEVLERIYKVPMDVEWIFDGKKLHILQVRPLQVSLSRPSNNTVSAFPILIGSPIGEGLITGVVQKVKEPSEPFKAGNVLVVETTSPEWEPLMRKARALITDKGSQTSHASLVAREMGLNAMVGTVEATKVLADGQTVTLDGNDLYTGFVYGGAVKPHEEKQHG